MYKFLRASEFFKQLRENRLCLVSGRQGSGKSLFSVALGHYMVAHGYVERAAFNFPVSFGASPVPRRCYLGVDELGLLFDNRSAFKDKNLTQLANTLTFKLRKSGSFLVAPSFLGVDKKFRAGVVVHRTTVGKQRWLWAYHWEVDAADSVEERRPRINYWEGMFLLFNPGFFFGSYDTYFVPGPQLTHAFMTSSAAYVPPASVPDDVLARYAPGAAS